MNNILVTITLAIVIQGFAGGQEEGRPTAINRIVTADVRAAEDKQVEKTLEQMEREVLAACVKGDTAALDLVWADEYSFTPPNGSVVSKENYIALLKSGTLRYESLELTDVKVRVYADTAVTTGRVKVKGQVGTHVLNGQDRFLTVYVKRQGRWQQVATQAARIAQQ